MSNLFSKFEGDPILLLIDDSFDFDICPDLIS